MKDNIIRFSFQDALNIIFHVFNSPTSKKPYSTLCLSVLRSPSLIPDIIEPPKMATAPFGHFTSATLLLMWAELIHSFISL